MLTQTLPLHLNPSISLKGVLSTTQARAHTHTSSPQQQHKSNSKEHTTNTIPVKVRQTDSIKEYHRLMKLKSNIVCPGARGTMCHNTVDISIKTETAHEH